MQFPIFIELRRSFVYSLLTSAMHGVAAICLFVVPLDWYWRAVAFPLVAWSLWSALRSRRVASLRLVAKEGLSFVEADGGSVEAALLPESTVFAWLVVLRFRVGEERKARALTLFPDQMSRDEFRMLRLWLRWNVVSGKGDDLGDGPDS